MIALYWKCTTFNEKKNQIMCALNIFTQKHCNVFYMKMIRILVSCKVVKHGRRDKPNESVNSLITISLETFLWLIGATYYDSNSCSTYARPVCVAVSLLL